MAARNVYVNMKYDQIYLNVIKDILDYGERTSNRTGIDCLQKIGLYFEIDLQKEFPLLTTKRIAWKSAFAEMLGFIRGYTNAADFRNLGCRVWDANANENTEWLNNSNRKGHDDLGLIYGYQWRNWNGIDQLRNVYNDLKENKDNRREIISAWNPSDLSKMALPPCHATMQFGLRENNSILDLFVYQRSQDLGLGNPFNVAQYSFLSHLMAKITGHKVGKLIYFVFNYHVYVNHIDALKQQYSRSILAGPKIHIHNMVNSLEFLENTPLPITDWVEIKDYNPHPAIKMEMAV
jgi:thymidylate synthase